MGILGNYEQQDALAPIRRRSYENAGLSESFFIRLVIKLSGGKIQNRRQIIIILLIFAGVVFIASAFLFFRNTGVTQHPIINAPSRGTVNQ